MLQLINEARTNPAAAAADAHRQHHSRRSGHPPVLRRQSPGGRADDRLGHAAAAAGLERRSGQRRPGTEPVHGRQPDSDRTPAPTARRPHQRMQAAGYTNIAPTAENAYAYSTSAEEAMQAFLIDWGVPSDGHRINIQQPGVSAQNAYRDVGIGIVRPTRAIRRSARWSSPRISPARPTAGPTGGRRLLRQQRHRLLSAG